MFCKKCGNQIPDGVKFCNVCGTPVSQPSAPGQNSNSYTNTNSDPYSYPNQNQTHNSGSLRGYNNGGAHIPTPSFLAGGSKVTWLSVMFILAAATMFCMILSGVVMSQSGTGFSMPITTVNSLMTAMNEKAGALGVYTVFLVIYIIIDICAVFLIFNKSQLGIIAGLLANLLVVIFSIVAICAAFGLAEKMGADGVMSTYPTIWTWLSLVLGLANGAFLVIKGRELTA